MKELDELYRYLDCRIDYNRKKCFIYISQEDFITRSLEKYSYDDLHFILSLWLMNIQIPKV